MYSLARFDLQRYSIYERGQTIPVAESFGESLNAVTGTAVRIAVRERYSEALLESSQGTGSIVTRLSVQEGLTAWARMSAEVLLLGTFSESLTAAARGGKNMPITVDAAEALSAKIFGCTDHPTEMVVSDALIASVFGSMDLPAEAFTAAETLTAMTEATTQTTDVTRVEISLPPGGELRIDSDLFVALLNGENVLYAQNGDWIRLSRKTLTLNIESSTGGDLEGQLIYTEAYL